MGLGMQKALRRDSVNGCMTSPKAQAQGQWWGRGEETCINILGCSSLENPERHSGAQEEMMLNDYGQLTRQGIGMEGTVPGPSPGQGQGRAALHTSLLPQHCLFEGAQVQWGCQGVCSPAMWGSPLQCVRCPPCWFYTFIFTSASAASGAV